MEIKENSFKILTQTEIDVIEKKGTEKPFTGIYENHFSAGTYRCKKCDQKLFDSNSKFHSNCGWPSFDDAIAGTLREQLDADGKRIEIVCANCNAHLGHLFKGEKFTKKDKRYCVNSISLNFSDLESEKIKPEIAYFAGGCFWGVQKHFNKLEGVMSTSAGFIGGELVNPTYRDVCSGTTGHAEVVQVQFNPTIINYEELAKLFFEIHDPTQYNRQGPDIGTQYRSAIFYTSNNQKDISEKLIEILKEKNYDVVTAVITADKFYKAEEYHQNYYEKLSMKHSCYIPKKRF